MSGYACDRCERQREDGAHGPNENKMSDGGQGRASLGMEVWKSSQKWSVQRSAVRSIAWLGLRDIRPHVIIEQHKIIFRRSDVFFRSWSPSLRDELYACSLLLFCKHSIQFVAIH
jgi:hypothetical protein